MEDILIAGQVVAAPVFPWETLVNKKPGPRAGKARRPGGQTEPVGSKSDHSVAAMRLPEPGGVQV